MLVRELKQLTLRAKNPARKTLTFLAQKHINLYSA